jgi:hypothetical protein
MIKSSTGKVMLVKDVLNRRSSSARDKAWLALSIGSGKEE